MPIAIREIAIPVHCRECETKAISVKGARGVVINLDKAIVFACRFLVVRPGIIEGFENKIIGCGCG